MINLEGTWLSIESRKSDGSRLGPFEPLSENARFTYEFNSNLSVFDSFLECQGNYSLNEQTKILQLFFDCIEKDIIWEVSSLEAEQLILSSEVAEEGLKVKFKK